MRLTDFCNRFSTRVPDERSILEVSDTLACTVTYDGAKAPAHDSSESAFDDAFSASAASLTNARIFRCGFERLAFLVGSSDRRTLARRPTDAAFSAVIGECESTSDVLCRWIRRAETLWTQPEPLPPPPRQRTAVFPAQNAFVPTSAHSVPLARHLEREPATLVWTSPSRLGFRRFFASRKRETRHRRFHGLIARERLVPRAARRLLQSIRFASTTDEPTELSTCSPTLRLVLCETRVPSCEGAGPRFHGSGTGVFWLLTCRLPPMRLLASGALPQPDWLGHLLSRTRGLRDWSCHVTFRARLRARAFAQPRPDSDFRRDQDRAASRTLPRRRARSAAPEVPSISEPPREEGPFIHTLSPVCGLRALRLFNPRAFRTP
jgi:hypothetical protein